MEALIKQNCSYVALGLGTYRFTTAVSTTARTMTARIPPRTPTAIVRM